MIPTKLDQLWFMREAGYVTRNHNWPTLRTQTDGCHSYNAVMIYLIFHPDPNFEAVKVLLMHDAGERGAGDLPAPAKWSNPDLNREYRIAEDKIMSRWVPLCEELSSEDSLWVALCDRFEFALFCLEEMYLGNRYAEQKLMNVIRSLQGYAHEDKMPKPLMPLWEQVRSRSIKMIDDMELF